MVGLFLVEMVVPLFLPLSSSSAAALSPLLCSLPLRRSPPALVLATAKSPLPQQVGTSHSSLALLKNVTTLVLGRPAAKLDTARQLSF